MPAVNEVVRSRPHRLTVVCWIVAVAIVVLFVVVAVLLGRPVHDAEAEADAGGPFGIGDQIGMVFLGVLLAAGALAFTRPRVVADAHEVRVRNVIGGITVPWTLVRAVRFDRHSPWAALELLDDELVSVLAVQAADKEIALDAVRGLRRLHAEAWGGSPPSS
ncbi:PH domain-containing protein [Cryptosporangium phraense]|uniref:PH domain-containing protein n=1 Tax=Cryptosporangium phraense TaxID=2593070 RepID=A0A545ALN9_9ACTN|nr:PH domain-containing protein [Cryptosporangium phraense]TQS41645.1 PH domain-containing protein [Cryptosporangium phraense]